MKKLGLDLPPEPVEEKVREGLGAAFSKAINRAKKPPRAKKSRGGLLRFGGCGPCGRKK